MEETRAPARELERAEVPWVVAYLREDLQDLHHDVRENTKAIRDSYERLDAKIDGLRSDMNAEIGNLRNDMLAVGWLLWAERIYPSRSNRSMPNIRSSSLISAAPE